MTPAVSASIPERSVAGPGPGYDNSQRRALDLSSHMVVSAAAGSGKTRVLVGRYLRILEHHGHQPHRIVAITFTEEAASQMAARIRDGVLARLSSTPSSDEKRPWEQALEALGRRSRHHPARLLPENSQGTRRPDRPRSRFRRPERRGSAPVAGSVSPGVARLVVLRPASRVRGAAPISAVPENRESPDRTDPEKESPRRSLIPQIRLRSWAASIGGKRRTSWRGRSYGADCGASWNRRRNGSWSGTIPMPENAAGSGSSSECAPNWSTRSSCFGSGNLCTWWRGPPRLGQPGNIVPIW